MIETTRCTSTRDVAINCDTKQYNRIHKLKTGHVAPNQPQLKLLEIIVDLLRGIFKSQGGLFNETINDLIGVRIAQW